MTHILRIETSARKQGSVSRKLTQSIIDRFPGATVTTRDLSGGLPVISEAWVAANFTPEADRSDAQRAELALSDSLIAEVKAADVLVIGLPIYNFSAPAAFKEWVDQIARAGVTFAYTENGPRGLLEGKRAIVAVASGGVPLGSDFDHASPYVRQVLGFIGITDVEFVAATGLNMDETGALDAANAAIAALKAA
ncbi:FMN-dependent NADH-azoreductase [Pseudoruegeria aquimaris]|uniref:FMN dependent NADH:quinone oxidoreductase n=1 Tax=Pseudoruegeria aquimaris TaxID=393663 RepID=A0A1Y5SAE1_9RHOB|nr:NAD(P)H-dependent oxidoreductase [Pseudoruegeria aquimaris]SLN35885.1 FMN-dependent NADH-azoreductase [Pseudoruegeria aquimaris]